MQTSSPFTLPDWLAITSFLVSLLSLFLGWFAFSQADKFAKRAEDLNAQTQEFLNQISSNVRTIEGIVNIQQKQQMNIISKSQDRLLDMLSQFNGNKASAESLNKTESAPGSTVEQYY